MRFSLAESAVIDNGRNGTHRSLRCVQHQTDLTVLFDLGSGIGILCKHLIGSRFGAIAAFYNRIFQIMSLKDRASLVQLKTADIGYIARLTMTGIMVNPEQCETGQQ